MKTWTSTHVRDDFVQVDIPLAKNKDWEWWLLLTSDHHFDSPHCDRELLAKHLQEAKDRGAAIHFNGDTFDLMQLNGDKRATKTELLSRYVKEDDPRHVKKKGLGHLDRVVLDFTSFYSKYASAILTISEGNHEDYVHQRIESNFIQRVVGVLNNNTGANIAACPYAGWIKFRFKDGEYDDRKSERTKCSVLLNYHHGYGGGAGKIVQRAATFPQADICVSGHSHEFESGKEWGQEFISTQGVTSIRNQTHIIIPSYKDEYSDKRSFGVKKFHRAKVMGAVWCRFYYDRKADRVQWQTMQAR